MIIQLFIEPIYYFLAKFDTIAFSHFIQGMDGVRDSSPHTPRLSSVFFPRYIDVPFSIPSSTFLYSGEVSAVVIQDGMLQMMEKDIFIIY